MLKPMKGNKAIRKLMTAEPILPADSPTPSSSFINYTNRVRRDGTNKQLVISA